MSKRYSGKSFKDSSVMKKPKLSLKEKKEPKKNLIVQSINEIIEPLHDVYQSLCSVKCEIIANGIVLDLIRRAYAFGLNLTKLDIRQESSRHSHLISSICKKLGLKDYLELTEDEKIKFLSKNHLRFGSSLFF